MDKLSIVEKAKRYDEAIKKLRSLHDNYDAVSTLIDVKEELENIFPELAESEGERIRKWCISHFKECINVIKDNDEYKEYLNNKVIPWLEKHSQVKGFSISQHKNKTCKENDDSLTSEDERIREELISNFKEAIENIRSEEIIPHSAKVLVCKMQKWIAWLEKKCEQKEVEPTPIFRIGDILKRKGKDYTFRVDRVQGGYYHCDRNHGAVFPIEEQNNWELVEQKLAEWSEEDEKMLDGIIEASTHHCYLNITDINWLKSLKERYTWKPNKEQMNGLKEAIEFLGCTKTRREPLQSLYEQLKKLK